MKERNYTVTWPFGRRGNLTRNEAEEMAWSMNKDLEHHAFEGRARVWYRDGTEVTSDEIDTYPEEATT